jgi:hypothetical protein
MLSVPPRYSGDIIRILIKFSKIFIHIMVLTDRHMVAATIIFASPSGKKDPPLIFHTPNEHSTTLEIPNEPRITARVACAR